MPEVEQRRSTCRDARVASAGSDRPASQGRRAARHGQPSYAPQERRTTEVQEAPAGILHNGGYAVSVSERTRTGAYDALCNLAASERARAKRVGVNWQVNAACAVRMQTTARHDAERVSTKRAVKRRWPGTDRGSRRGACCVGARRSARLSKRRCLQASVTATEVRSPVLCPSACQASSSSPDSATSCDNTSCAVGALKLCAACSCRAARSRACTSCGSFAG